MKRGLNSALYQIYNYFQQLILAFNSQQRTKEFLESKIKDPKMRDMVDLFNYVIRDAFEKMNEAVSASTLAYFEK